MGQYQKRMFKSEAPTILYLHGWGQTKESLCCIEELCNDFSNSILIDLPPFGDNSDYALMGMDNYFHFVEKSLGDDFNHIDLIVAHSFGGKVAMEYALNKKDIPLVLLAPSIIKPRTFWLTRMKIYFYKVLRKLKSHGLKVRIPKWLLGSDDYKNTPLSKRRTFLSIVHSYYDNELSKLNSSIDLFYGNDDQEIRLSQMRKAVKINKKVCLHKIKGNHFAFRREADSISKLIKERLGL